MRSSLYVRRHPPRGARRSGGQRFGTCGDSSRRVTRPHRGSLKTLGPLNVDVMMEHIEKVLNSHQELIVNDSFDITIAAIDFKGKREKTHYQPPGRQEFDTNQEISRHYRQ